MLYLFLRRRRANQAADADREAQFAQIAQDVPERLPIVTTQIPLYNEFNVAERVIRAVAAMDYPRERHEIQVLDDSDDETCQLVDAVAEDLQQQGYWIQVFRRADRTGYKAGALEAGMQVCQGEYIAIFDSDFIPPSTFLKRSLSHLWADPLWIGSSALGPRQPSTILAHSGTGDGDRWHFVVEQTARNRNQLFMNFCGTAGVWRKTAIEDSGGWEHDTVTEDWIFPTVLNCAAGASTICLTYWYRPNCPPLTPPSKVSSIAGPRAPCKPPANCCPRCGVRLCPYLIKSGHRAFDPLRAQHFDGPDRAPGAAADADIGDAGVWFYRSIFFICLLIPAALGPSLSYMVCHT